MSFKDRVSSRGRSRDAAPAREQRGMGDIQVDSSESLKILVIEDGAFCQVLCDYDSVFVRKIKARFLGAAFEHGAWRVAAPVEDVREWAREVVSEIAAEHHRLDVRRVALASIPPEAWRAAIADAKANPIVSPIVTLAEDGRHWLVPTTAQMNKHLVEIFQLFVGSTFGRQENKWRVPVTASGALREQLPRIERILNDAPVTLPGASVDTNVRYIELSSRMPVLGEPMLHGDNAIVPVRLGTEFPLHSRNASQHGFAGHAGERARYVYYREATPEETAALRSAPKM